MNIILIGFRCTGKSTIGKALAERLHWHFIDADDYLEQRYQVPIKDMFEHRGESWFRLLESDVIRDLARYDSTVIATGGGAVLRYKNMANLKRNGTIVLLEADPDTVYRRIQDDPRTISKRPPLTNKDPYTEVREQMAFRRPYYVKAADIAVSTSKRTVPEVVDAILEQLSRSGFLGAAGGDAAAAEGTH